MYWACTTLCGLLFVCVGFPIGMLRVLLVCSSFDRLFVGFIGAGMLGAGCFFSLGLAIGWLFAFGYFGLGCAFWF